MLFGRREQSKRRLNYVHQRDRTDLKEEFFMLSSFLGERPQGMPILCSGEHGGKRQKRTSLRGARDSTDRKRRMKREHRVLVHTTAYREQPLR